ncbi:MAG: hypothetical protein DMD48_13565 [Gemmatimonadetes bacterium]|nr:MAG: hypothetical protein DMD48_13565 [Gemmatimonadota bacterium]
MTPRSAALLVVLASAVSVCRPAPESRAPREHASAVAQQDTAFAGTLAPVQRVRSFPPGVARPVLRHVETRAGASPGGGYDRVVFEFTGDSVPGYHVEYATKPVQRCGSGDPVTVAGMGRLIVRFEPAQAHDERGSLAPAQRHRVPGLPAVRELTLICDFEGQVAWVLGIAAPSEYRVSELTGPARLVLDVRHAP